MNFIVLVKQVPDVTNIPIDAWDKEKGTLKRGMLDNVTNPLDLNALAFAYRVREQLGSKDSKILCITMGPGQAKDVLIDCLSRGADEAILLTDRDFAGADTAATSYTLAQAIKKIEKDVFKNKNYLIFAGMQSVDGDTAQVPPQVAEELNICHIAYSHTFEVDKELLIKRIGPHGMEIIVPREYPILITTTGCIEPLYRSFHRTRKAQVSNITIWGAQDINAEKNRIGLKGSKTQVYRIFSPSEQRSRRCIFPASIEQLIESIEKSYQNISTQESLKPEEIYNLGDKQPSYSGEIWVYAENVNGGVTPVSLELIAKAKELSAGLKEKTGVVLIGNNLDDISKKLINYGADKIYIIEHPLLKNFHPIPFKKTVTFLVKKYSPQILLFGATPLGRELAPRVAYNIGCGLTADCTNLEIDDYQQGKTNLFAILKQTRPALGGNIMATIISKGSSMQMATVRPGVFKALEENFQRKGEIIRESIDINDSEIKTLIKSIDYFPTKSIFTGAEIIISGGAGLGSKINFDKYTYPLAEALGRFLGGKTEVGASRMAVEFGFLGSSCQIGQTGQTVQPKLYVALGISGAVQHITGMQNSKIIVAINKDSDAQIFNYADFGIVGNLETVIPKIIEALNNRIEAKRKEAA
ncbi:MAG: FAD-binding protein [Actinobacteria bacterium]|nr:FAD-binding protein [Actinomycetota bacterium]